MPIDGSPSCPVCAAGARLVTSVAAPDVRRAMADALGVDAASVPDFPDYRLLRCMGCDLEFADPMLEPGEPLYAWLVASGLRYPARRWEWQACLADLVARGSRRDGIALLDVGCGSGGFLEVAGSTPGIRAAGIDLNRDVVASCRGRGLEAWPGTLAEWRRHRAERFDAICLWHVVEHVAEPVGTLEDARALLAPGGSIYFSVPVTPMSYEGAWQDPFNQPPHHLTRWTLRSLRALANRLGMVASFLLPVAEPRWRRTLRALVLAANNRASGPSALAKGFRLAAHVAIRPAALPVEWRRQGRRERDDAGRVLPDVVLVRLASPAG